jgi:hypothetical protein
MHVEASIFDAHSVSYVHHRSLSQLIVKILDSVDPQGWELLQG